MNIRRTIKKSKRFDVLKRDNFTCQYCGRSAPDVELEIDHLKPVSRGGSNEFDNLITSCKDCNRAKRDQEIVYSLESNKLKKQFDDYIKSLKKDNFDRVSYLLKLPEKTRYFLMTLEKLYRYHGKEYIFGFINRLSVYFENASDELTIKLIKNNIMQSEEVAAETKYLLLEDPGAFLHLGYPGKLKFLSEIWSLLPNPLEGIFDGNFAKAFELYFDLTYRLKTDEELIKLIAFDSLNAEFFVMELEELSEE